MVSFQKFVKRTRAMTEKDILRQYDERKKAIYTSTPLPKMKPLLRKLKE
jgi:hypothetical protein